MTRLTAALALAFATLTAAGCNNHEIVGVEYNHYADDFEEVDEVPGEADFVPLPTCGDAEVQEGEECDDGIENADEGACTSQCRINVCGDGIVFEGVEDCDDGEENGQAFCSEDCTPID
jgi:hypothetical protein